MGPRVSGMVGQWDMTHSLISHPQPKSPLSTPRYTTTVGVKFVHFAVFPNIFLEYK